MIYDKTCFQCVCVCACVCVCVRVCCAQVLDYLAIAVHELANISERRQERLMNSCTQVSL